ncbi:conjugal transfer protein (plasmid) [Candidatus Symbiopectobacterium sp. 'North America']|uniref:type II secretion system F family protein n=1 Tax=Candidatus Symbiopectobacterium sp. 'North America' TaxID=2794574 RepID=UPI0018CA952E|nr:type II secretion system F family protein [Candidatus Symbiopectobacterium sp. 'North America']MBG6246667.1 conjugal transfer protein [Candidatus Symbiopectobacterium sp. 'North America']
MNSFERYIYQKTFSASDRIEIYDSFRQYQLDGLSAEETFNKLIANYTRRGKNPGNAIGKILIECSQNLRAGFSLSESLREWLPDQEFSIIEACEVSGNLTEGFLNAMFIAEGTAKMTRAVKTAALIMSYMFSLAFSVIVLFCLLLVPTIKSAVPLDKWNGLQLAVWYFYVLITEYWYLLVAAFVITLYVVSKSLKNWRGSIRFVFDNIPPYSIYKRVNGAVFIINVNAMLSAGIPMEDAIRKMVDSCQSPWLLERLQSTLNAINSGEENLGTALDVTGYEFPGEEAIIKMQSLFETSNREGSLKRYANKWLEKTINAVENTGEVIRNISIIGCALIIVLLIVVMYDLLQQAFFFK